MLLNLAGAEGGTTLDDFMVAAHMSRAMAEELAISLYSMGIIDFAYDGTRFKVVTKEG